MTIYTDHLDWALLFFPQAQFELMTHLEHPLIPRLYKLKPHQLQSHDSNANKSNNNDSKTNVKKTTDLKNKLWWAKIPNETHWNSLFLTYEAPRSQFDELQQFSREQEIHENILTLARKGHNFHGFKQRPWTTEAGNLHLCALWSPHQEIKNWGPSLLALAAVSVLKTLDDLSLKSPATIKWVNDILISDKKVAGVLTSAQTMGSQVTSALVGIGLNVETSVQVERSCFVPETACLRDFSAHPETMKLEKVFHHLRHHLESFWNQLIQGHAETILSIYQNRSCLIGKEVEIYADSSDANQILDQGVVTAIGSNLELYLKDNVKDGSNKIFTKNLKTGLNKKIDDTQSEKPRAITQGRIVIKN